MAPTVPPDLAIVEQYQMRQESRLTGNGKNSDEATARPAARVALVELGKAAGDSLADRRQRSVWRRSRAGCTWPFVRLRNGEYPIVSKPPRARVGQRLLEASVPSGMNAVWRLTLQQPAESQHRR